MLVNEAIDLALARCAELGARVSGTKSLMIQRISQYQQRLYTMARDWNPDYYGTCVIATLDVGRIDLSDIIAPLEAIDGIERVEVADAGTSLLLPLDEVNIVPLNDRLDANIPPRAVIRRGVLEGVSTDLNNVISLRIHYNPIPVAIPLANGGATALQIAAPHDGLVPLDLALYLLDRIPAPDASTTQGRAGIAAEQVEAMALYERHVRAFAGTTARFG